MKKYSKKFSFNKFSTLDGTRDNDIHNNSNPSRHAN
jgi:hypothetical protein